MTLVMANDHNQNDHSQSELMLLLPHGELFICHYFLLIYSTKVLSIIG